MTIITMTSPVHTTVPEPPLPMLDLHQKEPWKVGLQELLITLGQKLMEHERHEGWLSMSQVAEFCRRYRLRWQDGSPKAKQLQSLGGDFFSQAGEIRSAGFKIEATNEWNATKRRQDLYFRFTELYPDGSSH